MITIHNIKRRHQPRELVRSQGGGLYVYRGLTFGHGACRAYSHFRRCVSLLRACSMGAFMAPENSRRSLP